MLIDDDGIYVQLHCNLGSEKNEGSAEFFFDVVLYVYLWSEFETYIDGDRSKLTDNELHLIRTKLNFC